MPASTPKPPLSPGLAGIRVLELGEMVSAPYTAKLLADLGADVIKIEPGGGDRARRRGPFRDEPDPDASGLFLALNTNKRSVVVEPDDKGQRLGPLLDSADILITNQRPEELRRIGVDLAVLHERRPELVICSILPFGLSGPHAHYRAEELQVSHGGGWAYLCPGSSSDPELPPLKVFGHQADFHAGLVAATVCLAAFDRAEATGVGDLIDLSSVSHTTGMLEAAVIAASYMDVNPGRLGSRLLNPWRIFHCSDGPIFLVVIEQDQWERLVELMGSPDWATTGLFDTVELRLENEDLLTLYLEEWIGEQTVDELWRRGQAERICFAPVLTMADLGDQTHLREREFLVDVEHPAAGTVTHFGPPFRAENACWGPLGPAPLLDQTADASFDPPRTVGRSDGAETRAMPRPLDGVRVLDLTWVWAGPYAAMHLAHLGAEVVKVESAVRPGLGRRLPIHPTDMEPTLNTSAYFNQWEQGKLSCQLDLSQPEAVELVKALAAECDIVIENFATGVMDRLGLGYDALRAIRPDIIVASISGYGGSGPLREFMGYGPTTGPLSGLTSLTGYPDGAPEELGISVGDPAAGITAAMATVAALVARRASGQGAYIDVALWEATASCAVEGWMGHELTQSPPQRMGNRDPLMAPHNCYRTADEGPPPADEPDPGRWIAIACATDDEWQALAGVIDPELVEDQRFMTAADRKSNEEALDAIIGAWTAPQLRWALTEHLQAAGVAAFPSMSPQDLLTYDHLWSRGFFEQLEHPEVGVRTHPGVPWLSATADNGVPRPAPVLGQHTAEILQRLLGCSAEAVEDLHRRGICA